MPKDMHSFIETVTRELSDELKLVEMEADPRFGVTAVAAKLEQRDQFPALYFPRVKGSSIPLIVNLCASYRRLALALETTVEQMVNVYADRQSDPIPPVEVDEAPCQEIVLTGSEANLGLLPITTHNELDAGPYITGGQLVCRDPYSGAYNVGLYRHQVQGPQQLGVWFWTGHHGDYIRQRYEEMRREMEVAIIIGHHPAFVMGTVSRIPGIGGEYAEAGALLGEPVELVKCKTVNLMVPARADIIIEGVLPPGERAFEGPFAEWPGHYTAEGEKPFIRVKAITRRRDAIYYDVFAAHREHTVLGSLPRMGSILRRVRQVVPTVRAVNVPAHSRMHCYVALKKASDTEVKKAAFQALLTEPENLKLVVVVDDDINVFNDAEVLWAIGTRFHADTDLLLIPDWSGPGGLNPAGYDFGPGGIKTPRKIAAMVIDATKPAPPAEYPPRARVPEEQVVGLNLEAILKPYVPEAVPVA